MLSQGPAKPVQSWTAGGQCPETWQSCQVGVGRGKSELVTWDHISYESEEVSGRNSCQSLCPGCWLRSREARAPRGFDWDQGTGSGAQVGPGQVGKQLRSAPRMLRGDVSPWGLHMGRGFVLGLADEGSPDGAVTAGSTPLPSQCPCVVAQNPSVSGSKSCPPCASGKLVSGNSCSESGSLEGSLCI